MRQEEKRREEKKVTDENKDWNFARLCLQKYSREVRVGLTLTVNGTSQRSNDVLLLSRRW